MKCSAVTIHHGGSVVECDSIDSNHVGDHWADVFGGNTIRWRTLADLDDPLVGKQHDPAKLQWSQLTPFLPALEEVARVLMFGAQKHNEAPGSEAWRTVENAAFEYGDAAARHALLHVMGQKFDPQTKRPHLAHTIANLLIVMMSEGDYL